MTIGGKVERENRLPLPSLINRTMDSRMWHERQHELAKSSNNYITVQAAAPTKALATAPMILPKLVTATSFTMPFRKPVSFAAAGNWVGG